MRAFDGFAGDRFVVAKSVPEATPVTVSCKYHRNKTVENRPSAKYSEVAAFWNSRGRRKRLEVRRGAGV